MQTTDRRPRSLLSIAALLLFCYWALQNLDRIIGWLQWGFELITPFLIGGALAFIFHVPMRAIERKLSSKITKGRRAIAFIGTLLGLLTLLAIVTGLVVPQLTATVMKLTAALPAFGASVFAFLENISKQFPFLAPTITEWTALNWKVLAENLFTFFTEGGSALVGDTVSAASGIFGGILNGIISFIFCIYILFGQEKLAKQGKMLLYAFLPQKRAKRSLEILARSEKTFSNFLTGQCLEAVILGLLFVLPMFVSGMPYITLISVLIGFTALIPLVGAFLGCIIGALLIAVENPMQAIWFCVLFIVIQQLEGNLIYPRVVGNSVGLPSMWVLVAVTIGGGIGGVVGMLITIPLFSVLYSILCETVYHKLSARGLLEEFLPPEPADETIK